MASRSARDAGLPEKGHLLCLILQDGIPQSTNTAESCCLGCSRTAEALPGQLCRHKYAMMQPHKLLQNHCLPACIVVALQTASDKARLLLEAWLHVQFLFILLCRLLTFIHALSLIYQWMDVKLALIQRNLFYRQQLLRTERPQKHKGPTCSALCSS